MRSQTLSCLGGSLFCGSSVKGVQGVDPVRAAVVEGVDVPGLGEPDLALDTVLADGTPTQPRDQHRHHPRFFDA
jgi:hypothetical protein